MPPPDQFFYRSLRTYQDSGGSSSQSRTPVSKAPRVPPPPRPTTPSAVSSTSPSRRRAQTPPITSRITLPSSHHQASPRLGNRTPSRAALHHPATPPAGSVHVKKNLSSSHRLEAHYQPDHGSSPAVRRKSRNAVDAEQSEYQLHALDDKLNLEIRNLEQLTKRLQERIVSVLQLEEQRDAAVQHVAYRRVAAEQKQQQQRQQKEDVDAVRLASGAQPIQTVDDADPHHYHNNTVLLQTMQPLYFSPPRSSANGDANFASSSAVASTATRGAGGVLKEGSTSLSAALALRLASQRHNPTLTPTQQPLPQHAASTTTSAPSASATFFGGPTPSSGMIVVDLGPPEIESPHSVAVAVVGSMNQTSREEKQQSARTRTAEDAPSDASPNSYYSPPFTALLQKNGSSPQKQQQQQHDVLLQALAHDLSARMQAQKAALQSLQHDVIAAQARYDARQQQAQPHTSNGVDNTNSHYWQEKEDGERLRGLRLNLRDEMTAAHHREMALMATAPPL